MGVIDRTLSDRAETEKTSKTGGETILEEHVENLLDALGHLDYGAAAVDGSWKILKSNAVFRSLLQLEEDAVKGTSLKQYMTPRSVEEFESCCSAFGKPGDGKMLCLEVELTARDGTPVFVEMRCFTQSLHGVGPVAVICLKDFTKTREAEKEKLREIDFLRNIIYTSQEGIVAADMKGRIILFNEGAENLLGYTAEEAIGNLHSTALYPPGVANEIMRMLRSPDYGGVGRLRAQNFIGITKGGERIPVSLSASIIYDEGEEIASVGIFTDLRERTRLHKKLEAMKLQVFQSEKMASLGKLAAGVAHEINNPLAGILLFSHILKRKIGSDEKAASDADRIIGDATRCKEIVQGLLDFAHQSGQQKLPVDLNRTIESGLALLVNQAMLLNVEVHRELEPTLPQVFGNTTQISQVLINLVMNAIDAMPDGGLLTMKTSYNEEKDRVCFEVSDTGNGIRPEHLASIFDPFFTTKDVGKGTGLGLSVVYGIVEDHGGRINVRSELGKGTTFTIELPAYKKREEEF